MKHATRLHALSLTLLLLSAPRGLLWPPKHCDSRGPATRIRASSRRLNNVTESARKSPPSIPTWTCGRAVRTNQGRDFDVFVVNTAELQRYIRQDLVVPIDRKAIPNLARQLPRFRDRRSVPGVEREGKLYAVPYTYSEMGLIYDPQQRPPVGKSGPGTMSSNSSTLTSGLSM